MYANMSHPAIVAGDFEKEEAAAAAATTETPRLRVLSDKNSGRPR